MLITTDPKLFLEQQSSNRDNGRDMNDSEIRKPRLSIGSLPSGLEVYTVHEAAGMLHPSVPNTAIYRLINSGALEARKVGKQFLISKKGLKGLY